MHLFLLLLLFNRNCIDTKSSLIFMTPSFKNVKFYTVTVQNFIKLFIILKKYIGHIYSCFQIFFLIFRYKCCTCLSLTKILS